MSVFAMGTTAPWWRLDEAVNLERCFPLVSPSVEHPTACWQWAWCGYNWYQIPRLLLTQRCSITRSGIACDMLMFKSFVLKAGVSFIGEE